MISAYGPRLIIVSGASYVSTVKLPPQRDSLSYLRTFVVCRDTTCDLTFVPPPDTCPSPITIIADIYPLFCIRVGMGRCPRRRFSWDMTVRGGDKCPAARVTHKRHLLGQLSLASLRGRLIEYQFRLG